jgi:hypothetical protein
MHVLCLVSGGQPPAAPGGPVQHPLGHVTRGYLPPPRCRGARGAAGERARRHCDISDTSNRTHPCTRAEPLRGRLRPPSITPCGRRRRADAVRPWSSERRTLMAGCVWVSLPPLLSIQPSSLPDRVVCRPHVVPGRGLGGDRPAAGQSSLGWCGVGRARGEAATAGSGASEGAQWPAGGFAWRLRREGALQCMGIGIGLVSRYNRPASD